MGDTYLTLPEQCQIDASMLESAQQTLAALPEQQIPTSSVLPPGSRMLLTQNPFFVGRDDVLLQIATILKGTHKLASPNPILAITGMGGIGKTQIATEFVHRYGHYFAGGVFWLNFASASSISAQIAACGSPEYLSLWPVIGGVHPPSLNNQVALVYRAWNNPIPRLLVFDNCEDEVLFQRWRTKTGGCRMLITSRRVQWTSTLGVQVVHLDVLKHMNGVKLLRKYRCDLRLDDPNLHAITTELGDLPLALHLSGRYLAQFHRSITPATYREQLSKPNPLAIKALEGYRMKPELSPTQHDENVAQTIALSYDQLNKAEPTDALALSLLARIAYFASGEPIPHDLVIRTLDLADEPDAAIEIEGALNRLIDLGLVEIEANDAVRVHRLTATFVRTITTDGSARTAVEQVMLDLARTLNRTGYPTPLLALQPHLRAITNIALEHQEVEAAALCNSLGYHLDMIGAYREAQYYYEQALAICRRLLGPDHPDTAACLNNLAAVLDAQSQYCEAQHYYEQALEINKRVLGPNHPSTATSLNNLGFVLRAQGQYTKAQDYYEQALSIRQQVLSPDHPNIATSLNNLGGVLRDQGQYPEAQRYYEQALKIHERAFGPDHPDTALSLNNLGAVLRDQAQYTKAHDYYKQALAIYRRVLGPDHPDTVGSLNNVGLALRDQGQYPEAQRTFEQTLTIRQQILGPDHPDTATSLNDLGMVLQAQGQYTEAQRYFEQALHIRQRVLGHDHPNTAMSLANLGSLIQAQGQYAEARRYYEQALEIQQRVLGKDHPKIAWILNGLGEVLQEQGQYTEAQRYFEQALDIVQRLLNPDHPDTASILNNMGSVLYAQGHSEAQGYFEQALAIRKRVLGPDHPDTHIVRQNLAHLVNQHEEA